MPDYTPKQYAARLRRWSRGTGADSLRGALEAGAREASDIIAGVSIGQFMRNAGVGGNVVRPSPRRFNDRGPLRIVSGTLAKAMRAPNGREGGISKVTIRGGGVMLEKGVSLRVAKGGHNEGRRAKSGVSLSFLRPAVDASTSRIAKRAEAILAGSFLSHVGGRAGGV